MIRVYDGSCHCRAVQFTTQLDLAAGTTKCNCTWCWKHRWWSARVEREKFELKQGADVLSNGVQGGFCQRCGVMTFRIINTDGWGEGFGGDMVSLSVAALDELDPALLIEASVQYCDGLHNDWLSPPSETRHL